MRGLCACVRATGRSARLPRGRALTSLGSINAPKRVACRRILRGETMALGLRELEFAEREVLTGDTAPDRALSRRGGAIPFL
jgi:hypothetical protein